MLNRLAAAAALIAATLAPVGALAQQGRSTSVPAYTYVQLTVNTAAVAPAEFKDQTEAIRSCDDARKLAGTLNAQVNSGRSVSAAQLPPQLRPILAETPAGRATPVLAEGKLLMHVVVVCQRS